ncbi:MAG: pilus assembly protein [Bdellovibrionales bacterium]|nr:pilus assembly protein [Bdellovibrionales bacterium]
MKTVCCRTFSRPIPLRSKLGKHFGVAAVELALVMPLLFLILFGMIQWGLIISAQIAIQQANEVAVRSALLFTPNDPGMDDLQEREEQAKFAAQTALPSTVHWDPVANPENSLSLTEPVPDMLQADMTYAMNLMMPFLVPNSQNGKLYLRAKSVIR